MSTWTNLTKGTATFTNLLKRVLNFLLSEDDTFLLSEDGTKIIIDRGIEWTNLTKSL